VVAPFLGYGQSAPYEDVKLAIFRRYNNGIRTTVAACQNIVEKIKHFVIVIRFLNGVVYCTILVKGTKEEDVAHNKLEIGSKLVEISTNANLCCCTG
jgi:hypothetical protein